MLNHWQLQWKYPCLPQLRGISQFIATPLWIEIWVSPICHPPSRTPLSSIDSNPSQLSLLLFSLNHTRLVLGDLCLEPFPPAKLVIPLFLLYLNIIQWVTNRREVVLTLQLCDWNSSSYARAKPLQEPHGVRNISSTSFSTCPTQTPIIPAPSVSPRCLFSVHKSGGTGHISLQWANSPSGASMLSRLSLSSLSSSEEWRGVDEHQASTFSLIVSQQSSE